MSRTESAGERAVRAQTKAKLTEQAQRDQLGTWEELAAASRRTDENTVRLRALRLAKEQPEAIDPSPAVKRSATAHRGSSRLKPVPFDETCPSSHLVGL